MKYEGVEYKGVYLLRLLDTASKGVTPSYCVIAVNKEKLRGQFCATRIGYCGSERFCFRVEGWCCTRRTNISQLLFLVFMMISSDAAYFPSLSRRSPILSFWLTIWTYPFTTVAATADVGVCFCRIKVSSLWGYRIFVMTKPFNLRSFFCTTKESSNLCWFLYIRGFLSLRKILG